MDYIKVKFIYLKDVIANGIYMVLCPYHKEKTPSCIINTKTMIFHCFGCGKRGEIEVQSHRIVFKDSKTL